MASAAQTPKPNQNTLVDGSVQRVQLPEGSPWESQPWVAPSGTELWYSAKHDDCADGGNPVAACVYSARLVNGAWTARTLEVRPKPLATANEGDAVGVGECNPATVPQTGETRLVCSACLHHAAAPKCEMKIITSSKVP